MSNPNDERHPIQCELSIVTATKLSVFIAQYEEDRKAASIQESINREKADKFREKVLSILEEIAPPVMEGKRIARGLAWTIAVPFLAAIMSGIAYGLWEFFKFLLRKQ